MACTRLADMDPEHQAEVLALLDVRVTITGPIPQPRLGKPCSLAQWFKDNDRLVPDELTEEAYALIEPVIKAWEPPNHRFSDHRTMVNGILYKARTGTLWFDLPERFGTRGGLHSRYKRWAEVGVWDQIMAALPNTGQPVWTPPPLVPPFRVEGRIDPRVLTDADPTSRPKRWPEKQVSRHLPPAFRTRARPARRSTGPYGGQRCRSPGRGGAGSGPTTRPWRPRAGRPARPSGAHRCR